MVDERRLVTVLFADVTGSTALGESLDPEDLRALLSRYYAIAKDVVAAHGGAVEKFIGDAVMAVFGLRQAHGDDAARAIAAALELRDRVRSDPRLGDRLPIRLGVNTGDVVASRSDSNDDFLVTGDAVNVAARLQQAAEPWSILCGARTVRATRAAYRFGPERPVDAKGKATGVFAREALASAGPTSARTPLFGRDADLAQLELVARRAFDEERPFLVSVIAPPGTGKTRLLEEFLAMLPGIDENALVAVAQCLPYGQRLTYWPLRQVLFRIVGLAEDAPSDEVRSSVQAWLRAAEVNEAPEVGALLTSTIGAGDVEAVDRAALFAAWRTFIEAASRTYPLVVAVEDLHWSSDTLLDLLEFVLQPRGDTRAVMIALARPEMLDRRPGWGGGRRNHVAIALEPLKEDAIAQLVRHLAEGAPSGFIEAVVERAEGNPFFAGEIVNALMEGLRSFNDPTEVRQALAKLPDTVQATVLARLDLLPEDEREVIRVGAVFGRTFRPSGVAALMGHGFDSDRIAQISERLADRDLVRLAGADGFAFRHILIREIAYATLPRAARATLHGAAGRWLEGRASGHEEAYAELVAYHFREAASLATAMELDGADELRGSALMWLVRAADVARGAAATVEARQHVREAIEFATPDRLPELTEMLGDVEIGGSTIIETYNRALTLARTAERGPDVELRLIAKILTVETRSQGAVANRASQAQIDELRREGKALLDRATDQHATARFYVADAFYPFWLRGGNAAPLDDDVEVQAAEQSARTGLEIAESIGDFNLQSAALDALGSLAQQRNDWALASELGRKRIAMGSRLVLLEQIDAHSVVTWSETLAGNLEEADRVSAAGLAILQPRQAPDWALHLIAWRTVALQELGKWNEVEAAADRMYGLWLESGRPAAGYSIRGWAAALMVARARRDEARIARWSEIVTEIGSQFPDRREMSIAVARGDIEAVAAAVAAGAQQPVATLPYDGATYWLSICTDADKRLDESLLLSIVDYVHGGRAPVLEAEALRALGYSRRDATLLEDAQRLYEAAHALPYVARARCEAAIIRGDRAKLEAGVEYLESIRDEVQVETYLRASRERNG